ncbi:MAG TPA: hypothetical protein VNA25_28710 [Phycisphaerae bacterium]|nr:hypothetical protein [Phycisphaerae bacterium]
MMTKICEDERMASLRKYFIWADLMRRLFDQILRTGNAESMTPDREGFAYMSYWYGALYVVIEGWCEMALSDDAVDSLLLEKDRVSLLLIFVFGM